MKTFLPSLGKFIAAAIVSVILVALLVAFYSPVLQIGKAASF